MMLLLSCIIILLHPPEATFWTVGVNPTEFVFRFTINETPAALAVLMHAPKL